MKITLLNNLPILTFRRNLEDLIYKLKITRGVIYPTLFLSFGYWAYYFHEKNHLTIALALLLLAFIRLRKGSITLLSPTLTLIVLTFCLLSPTLQIVFLESSIQTLFPAIAFFLIYALSADTYTKAKDDELIWGLVFSTLIFHLFYHVHEYFLQSMALICALLICAKFHVFWTLSIFFGAALFFGDSISKSVWLTIAFAIFASRIRFSLNPVFKFWYFFSAPLINIGAVYLLDRGSRTTNIFSGRPLIWEFWIENAFLPHWLFGIGPKESLIHQEIYQKALEHQIETNAVTPAFHSIFINTLATTGLSGIILIYCVLFIRYLKINNFIANFLFLTIWPLVHFQNFSQILGTSPTTLILLASIFLGATSSKNAFTHKS